MARPGFKYDVFAKELLRKGLVYDEVSDYAEAFRARCEKIRERRAAKSRRLNELVTAREYRSMELTVDKNIVRELLQEQMKRTAGLQDILDKICAAEEGRNASIAKFNEKVYNFENTLYSLKDEFGLDNLNDELSDVATEQITQKYIEDMLRRLQNIEKRLEGATEAIPKFNSLTILEKHLSVNKSELQEKERHLAMLKQALQQMEAKVQNN